MEIDRPFIGIAEEEIINHPDTFPKIDFEHPMTYKGWGIYKWTGWKGNWMRRNPASSDPTPTCEKCGKSIEMWDLVYLSPSIRGVFHAECYPEYNGEIFGQWLASFRIGSGSCGGDLYKYAYSSAPGAFGLYSRGACFDLGISREFTYFTDPDELIVAQSEALDRLKAFIDKEVENANLRIQV